MNEIKERVARGLLAIGAVFLRPEEPFTWASGIKSPIYCDNRLTLTAPEVRDQVENGLMETIRREYPDVEVLMGTSTAGIAHAAIVAHMMHLPMGYVRGGNKDHGRQNRIEGKLEKGQKVVVVEDLISTGGSVIEGFVEGETVKESDLPEKVAQAIRDAYEQVKIKTITFATYMNDQVYHVILSEPAGEDKVEQFYIKADGTIVPYTAEGTASPAA